MFAARFTPSPTLALSTMPWAPTTSPRATPAQRGTPDPQALALSQPLPQQKQVTPQAIALRAAWEKSQSGEDLDTAVRKSKNRGSKSSGPSKSSGSSKTSKTTKKSKTKDFSDDTWTQPPTQAKTQPPTQAIANNFDETTPPTTSDYGSGQPVNTESAVPRTYEPEKYTRPSKTYGSDTTTTKKQGASPAGKIAGGVIGGVATVATVAVVSAVYCGKNKRDHAPDANNMG
jgi:hypothetical protein